MLCIRRLTLALLFLSRVALGEGSSVSVLCQDLWNGKQPNEYLYDFQKDTRSFPDHLGAGKTENYQAYLDKLLRHGLDRKGCQKKWTVFIYMVATSNILPYAYADLNEMEASLGAMIPPPGSSIRTDVVVQFDDGESQRIRRLHVFPDQEKIFEPISLKTLMHLSEESIRSPVISIFDKIFPQNEKERLRAFLKWGIQEYPSEHYLVLIWGHGQGWTSISSDDPESAHDPRFGGIAIGRSKTFLDIPALRGVLGEIHELTGDKVDVFASDACLMQSTENLAEISGHTHYICGSEDLQSFAGFPYGILLSKLNSSEVEPRRLASIIPTLYQDSFSPTGTQKDLDPNAFRTITESAVSSEDFIQRVLPHLNKLGNLLLEFMEESPIRFIFIKAVIEEGQTFQDRNQDSGSQDLGLFLKALVEAIEKNTESEGSTSPATLKVMAEIPLVRDALNQSIVSSIFGEKYPKFNQKESYGAQGISIWLPRTTEEFQRRIDDFSQSIFYNSKIPEKISGWHKFMLKMYP